MFAPAGLELLDCLGCQAEGYWYLERCVFDRDREHALRSIEKMWQDGMITVSVKGSPVEIWKWQEWRRMPYARATSLALRRVRLELTKRAEYE